MSLKIEQDHNRFKQIIKLDAGVDFPEDPYEQLKMAIGAVFGALIT